MLDDPHAPGDADGPDSADEPVTANMEVNEPENGSVAFSAGFGGDTSPFPLYTWPRAWLDRTDFNSPQMAEGLGHIAARQAEAVAHYISALTEAQADLEAPLVREAAAALAEVGQSFVLFHQYYTGGMIPTGENLEEDETRRRFAEEEDRLEDLRFDESEDLVEPGPPQNEFGVPLASGIEVAAGPWGRIAVSEFVVHSEGIKITLSAVFRQRALSEVFDIDPFSVIAPIEPLDPHDDAVDEIEAEEAAMAAQYSSHGDVRIQPMGREWFPSTDPEFLVASQPLWISPLPTADLEITAAFPHIRVTDAQFTLPAAGIAEARAHIVTVTADDEPW